MKTYKTIERKTPGQLLKRVVLITSLGLVWFCLPIAHGQQQSVQKSTSTTQAAPVRKTFKPVTVSAAELKTFNATLTVKTITATQPSVASTSMVKPIDITSPVKDETWEAGKEYLIKWSRASKDVRIDLVSPATANKPREKYPIIARTPNTGTYSFKVPYNFIMGSKGYVQVESLDGKENGSSQSMNVYTQLVDLECKIVDAHLAWSSTDYVIYYEKDRWLEFNVLMRNKGTMSPVTIREVLVRLIKEPENIVALQEVWGFSDIYGHEWRRLPEPLKVDIKDYSRWWIAPYPIEIKNTDINLKSGSYRLEVELDPQNSLHENQQTRDDNKCVQTWDIR